MNSSSCKSIGNLFCKTEKSSDCNCSNNSRQSPIDINEPNIILGKTDLLKVDYNEVQLKKYSDKEKYHPKTPQNVLFNGYIFTLVNLHFHRISEHTYKGQKYDMEVHLVHKAPDVDEYVVLAFFIKLVDKNESDNIMDQAAALQDDAIITIPNLEDRIYFIYKGSLTTDTFIPNVEWCIFQEPLHMYISPENREKHGSARQIQTTVYASEVLTFTYN